MNAHRWGFLILAEAWWELLRSKVRLRVASGRARWLSEALCLPGPARSTLPSPLVGEGEGGGELALGALAAAVDRASRYHLRPMRCLNRSLALLWMLRRRGISTALRVGCRRQGDDLDFHAWLVDGNAKMLFDASEQNAFLPLQRSHP